MGEVYRATDPNLHRDVPVKRFTEQAERPRIHVLLDWPSLLVN